MVPRSRLLLAPLLTVALAACAGRDSATYPSLAPRPIERALGDLPPATGACAVDGDGCAIPAAPAPAAPTDDAAFRAEVAALADRTRQAQLAFEAMAPGVREAVNRAGAYGSDEWVAAQQRVSQLERTRAPIVEAIAALDALAMTREPVPTTEADQALLDAAVAEAARIDALQREELAQLGAALSPE